MAGESVQNLTGQLLNTRGAVTAGDSYLNVINIGLSLGAISCSRLSCVNKLYVFRADNTFLVTH